VSRKNRDEKKKMQVREKRKWNKKGLSRLKFQQNGKRRQVKNEKNIFIIQILSLLMESWRRVGPLSSVSVLGASL
jgi:hypothetical protein